jgi:hypothetical protein
MTCSLYKFVYVHVGRPNHTLAKTSWCDRTIGSVICQCLHGGNTACIRASKKSTCMYTYNMSTTHISVNVYNYSTIYSYSIVMLSGIVFDSAQ